jgi:hypothetical protein
MTNDECPPVKHSTALAAEFSSVLAGGAGAPPRMYRKRSRRVGEKQAIRGALSEFSASDLGLVTGYRRYRLPPLPVTALLFGVYSSGPCPPGTPRSFPRLTEDPRVAPRSFPRPVALHSSDPPCRRPSRTPGSRLPPPTSPTSPPASHRQQARHFLRQPCQPTADPHACCRTRGGTSAAGRPPSRL